MKDWLRIIGLAILVGATFLAFYTASRFFYEWVAS